MTRTPATLSWTAIQSLALAEITTDKVLDTLKEQATHVGKELLHRVPDLQEASVSWLNQFLQGKLVIHVDTHDLTEQIDGLDTTFLKLTAGLIITGMIVGTAIVTTHISLLWPVFVVLLIIGLRLSWRMLRPPRRP